MKRLAFAIVAAAITAGCEPKKHKQSELKQVEAEYEFEVVGSNTSTYLEIVRVTNTKTGRSLKVMKYGGGGLITLPGEF